MCGINFILDKRSVLDEQPIGQMNRHTKHRGPDASGIDCFTTQNHQYFFGANRLMIVDGDECSNQPFIDEQKKACLIFNGEIYNFFDLKNKLLDYQVQFRTQSDTEVLYYWLKIFGKSGLPDIEGMFAFIFFDYEHQSVIMARDRFGIKPLYFFNDHRYLIASSEAKGILASGLVDKKLNEEAVWHYMAFRYSNKPQTFFENIEELPAGYCLLVNSNGEIEKQAYHNFKYANQEEVTTTRVEGLIRNSFLKQLYSKKPMALMLSGGIDSTLLLALAHEERINLPAFTVVNNRKDRRSGTSDYKYATLIANKLGADHYKIAIGAADLEHFAEWVKDVDQPIADSGAWMTYKLCQQAHIQNYGVLLSGAGADELFAGYNRHWAFYKYLMNWQYLVPFSKYYQRLSKHIPKALLSGKLKYPDIFLRSIDKDASVTYQNFLNAPYSGLYRQGHVYRSENKLPDMFRWCLDHDLKNYLVHDVLNMTDQMSMQFGVEVRLPYLDNALSSYLFNARSNSLIAKGRKWLLKSLLEKHDLSGAIYRKKEGFGMPLAAMFRNDEDFGIWDLFQNENSTIFKFIEQAFFKSVLKGHKSGRGDYSQVLWSILFLGHWLKNEFE